MSFLLTVLFPKFVFFTVYDVVGEAISLLPALEARSHSLIYTTEACLLLLPPATSKGKIQLPGFNILPITSLGVQPLS